jgi:serine phosphatase RsbU (regulator of sigma subunit)
LLSLLEQGRTLPASAIQEKIIDAVSEFSGGHRTDDATLLVLAVGE